MGVEEERVGIVADFDEPGFVVAVFPVVFDVVVVAVLEEELAVAVVLGGVLVVFELDAADAAGVFPVVDC